MENFNAGALFESMMSGEVTSKSKLGARDKRLQTKPKKSMITTHKNEAGKSYKYLLLKQVSVPFNPLTGKADEKYNAMEPYLPEKSVTSTLLALKAGANAHEEAKNAFMKRAGVSEWDTENLTELNKSDIAVFRQYLEPRIFTVPTYKVTYGAISKNKYGKTFILEGERDPETMMLLPESIPTPLRISSFHGALLSEKVAKMHADVKSGVLKYNTTEEENKEKEIWQTKKITGEIRSNFAMGLELNVTDDGELDCNASICEEEDSALLERFKLLRYNGSIMEQLKNFNTKWKAKDKFGDFYDLQIDCPNLSDPKEVGQKTSYGTAVTELSDIDFSDGLCDRFREFIDKMEDQEKLFRDSSYLSRYTDKTEEVLLKVAAEDIRPLLTEEDGIYVTEKVVERHSDIIQLLFPEEADEILAKAGIGMLEEGTYNEKATEARAKEADAVLDRVSSEAEGNAAPLNGDLKSSRSMSDILDGDDEILDL